MDKRTKTWTGLLSVLCLAFAPGGALLAGGGAPAALDKLVPASDGVIVGRIVAGNVGGTSFSISIEIERALKGSLVPGGIVQVAGTISEPQQARVVPPYRGIFFLAGKGGSSFQIVPTMNGYLIDEASTFVPLPQASTPAAHTGSAATLKESILLELLGALESGAPQQPGGMIDLFAEYRSAPGPVLQSVFRRWMASGASRLAAIAVQALVAEGDTEALARVESDPDLRKDSRWNGITGAVKYYFKNPDPNAVGALGRLAAADSSGPELRVAAASALARIHTRETLGNLAGLLDSPDAAVRALAVGGLSMFANNVPIGEHHPAAGDWPFRTEETIAHSAMDTGVVSQNATYYIGFWKDWWARNQAKIVP